MKLSDIAAKLTWMKSNAVRTLAAGAVAVAALAAVPAANAQQFRVGVQIGGPRVGYAYVPPARYYGHDYRYDRFYRDHNWREHERWEHVHRGW